MKSAVLNIDDPEKIFEMVGKKYFGNFYYGQSIYIQHFRFKLLFESVFAIPKKSFKKHFKEPLFPTHFLCDIYFADNSLFFQSLILLSYLVKNGSERVVTSAREHIYDLRRLESYTFTDENGKDQGLNGKQKNHFKKKYINNQNTIILTKTDLQDRDISWPAVLIK